MQDCFHGGQANHLGDKAGRYRCLSCNHYWCKACVEQAATAAVTTASMGKGLGEKASFAAQFASGACPSCKQPNVTVVTGAATLR